MIFQDIIDAFLTADALKKNSEISKFTTLFASSLISEFTQMFRHIKTPAITSFFCYNIIMLTEEQKKKVLDYYRHKFLTERRYHRYMSILYEDLLEDLVHDGVHISDALKEIEAEYAIKRY